jgi:transposase
MTNHKRATDWLEGRRLRAWELKQQGWKQKDIAAALGASEGAVSQWMARGRAGGIEGLRRKPPPGVTPRLSQAQREQLPSLLKRGAEASGFRGEVWTGGRVAVLIERAFGVRYHEVHARRWLKAIGWSQQKPVKRASGRDEAAIERWQREDWPALKKRR